MSTHWMHPRPRTCLSAAFSAVSVLTAVASAETLPRMAAHCTSFGASTISAICSTVEVEDAAPAAARCREEEEEEEAGGRGS